MGCFEVIYFLIDCCTAWQLCLSVMLGAVRKLCQRPKGGGGGWKMPTMDDKGGRGGQANADNG